MENTVMSTDSLLLEQQENKILFYYFLQLVLLV